MPGWSRGPDGCHAPAIQHRVTREGSMGSGAAGNRASNKLAELACFRTADYQNISSAAGASRYDFYPHQALMTSTNTRMLYAESKDTSTNPDDGKVNRANRNFSHNHAMSIHLNAIALVATVWYGFSFASGLL